jgi:hypothetical protein
MERYLGAEKLQEHSDYPNLRYYAVFQWADVLLVL